MDLDFNEMVSKLTWFFAEEYNLREPILPEIREVRSTSEISYLVTFYVVVRKLNEISEKENLYNMKIDPIQYTYTTFDFKDIINMYSKFNGKFRFEIINPGKTLQLLPLEKIRQLEAVIYDRNYGIGDSR